MNWDVGQLIAALFAIAGILILWGPVKTFVDRKRKGEIFSTDDLWIPAGFGVLCFFGGISALLVLILMP